MAGKKRAGFLSQLDVELPRDQQSRLGLPPKEMKTGVHTKTCPQMFTATQLTIAQKWRQPTWPPTEERTKCDPSTHWSTLQP